jgi:1,4-alpha-glucan branching enzyme
MDRFSKGRDNWSFHYARRLWHLSEDRNLKYHYLGDFDSALMDLINDTTLLECPAVKQLAINITDQVLAFERKDHVFVFNFNPSKSFFGYRIPVNLAGTGYYLTRTI